VNRVLPEEEDAASLLSHQIQAEFQLDGAMELSIGRSLVQNELQAARIEKFAVQELIKAGMLAALDVDSHEQKHFARYPCPKECESDPGFCTRLRPAYCVKFLNNLKRLVEKRGPQPDEDKRYLTLMYGSQLTPNAESILILYNGLKTNESLKEADENTKEQKIGDYQARIVEAIDQEIRAQEIRKILDVVRELHETPSDPMLLPSPEVDERIERHRTAQIREKGRLLGILETIRRLKSAREVRTNPPQ